LSATSRRCSSFASVATILSLATSTPGASSPQLLGDAAIGKPGQDVECFGVHRQLNRCYRPEVPTRRWGSLPCSLRVPPRGAPAGSRRAGARLLSLSVFVDVHDFCLLDEVTSPSSIWLLGLPRQWARLRRRPSEFCPWVYRGDDLPSTASPCHAPCHPHPRIGRSTPGATI
jgi:hypothetical protein